MAGDFGTRFMPQMALSRYSEGAWDAPHLVPSDRLELHPGAHVLHYASTCFEGLKAFRHGDGSVQVFRMDRNIARFTQSSRLLHLPPLESAHTEQLIRMVLEQFRDDVPAPPASMYIRPTHIGIDAAIGKAADVSESSLQYVLLSPVGDYFTGGEVALKLYIEDQGERCGFDHGCVKGGGNYASALKHIIRARETHGAHQVLFASADGGVTETGAANFILINDDELITKPLDKSFLHGVTRDSILQLARDAGYSVREVNLPVQELLERAKQDGAEAGLAGTAAVLTAVGEFIYEDQSVKVGDGTPGPRIRALREALNAIQWGLSEDRHGWLSRI